MMGLLVLLHLRMTTIYTFRIAWRPACSFCFSVLFTQLSLELRLAPRR